MIALAHLLARGVRLEAREAVALAQELIGRGCGVPSVENIHLGADGSASCISGDGAPSVADVAGLLQGLLPPGAVPVSAPLRYAIARGMQAVEAPPFASLEDLSRSLARFEGGDRREVLRALLQRAARDERPPVVPVARPVVVPTPIPARLPGAAQVPDIAPLRPVASPSASAVVSAPVPGTVRTPVVVPVHDPLDVSLLRHAEVTSSPPESSSGRALRFAAVAAVILSFVVGFGVMNLMSESTDPAPAAARSESLEPSSPAVVAAARKAEPNTTPPAPTPSMPVPPVTAPADAAPTPSDSPVLDAKDTATAERPVATSGTVAPVAAVSGYPAAFSPAFGASGTAIFFHTGGARDSRSAIEVATAAGSPGGDLGIMTVVDDGAKNYHPQPSPDGRFVAFDSDRDGERGIYIADRDGKNVRRISGDGYAASPTWSRDGEQLAYIRAEANSPSVWNLWVQQVGGGAARRATSHRSGQTWAASWFPDSHHISYTHEDKLYVLDLPTGESRTFDSPVKGRAVRTPAVSPDGTKVIFQVFRHGAWLLDLGDGSMQCVLTDPTAEEFAWAPDGRRVAFHSRRDGRWGIYVLSQG